MTAGGLDAAMKAAMAASEPTPVTFGKLTVRVQPPMQWRQSAMEAITTGQFNTWARGALVNDYTPAKGTKKAAGSDDAAAFVAADLTNAEVVEFFAAYADVAGQSPGE